MGLVMAFNDVAMELNVTGMDGAVCSLPVKECHDDKGHHDSKDHQGDDHHDDEDHEESGMRLVLHSDPTCHVFHLPSTGSGSTDSRCLFIYKICEDLILHTNLTSASCLSGECPREDNHTSSSSSEGPSSGEGE